MVPIWLVLVVMLLALLAGIGVQKLIDRVWPPPYYAPLHSPEPPPSPARKVLEFEDTLDAIGSGHAIGYETGYAAARRDQFRGAPGYLPPAGFTP